MEINRKEEKEKCPKRDLWIDKIAGLNVGLLHDTKMLCGSMMNSISIALHTQQRAKIHVRCRNESIQNHQLKESFICFENSLSDEKTDGKCNDISFF